MRTRHLRSIVLTALLTSGSALGAACSIAVSTDGLSDGSRADSAAPLDAGSPDAGPVVTSAPDAESPVVPDATLGPPDAESPDGTAPDASAPDASVPDSGSPDSVSPDGGPLATTTDLTPQKDAYVQDGNPADSNFGTDPSLVVKTLTGTARNRNSWVSFDVSALSGISAARLRLFVVSVDTNNTNPIPSVVYYPPDSVDGWVEATITWNNAPAAGSVVVGSVTVDDPQVGTWIEYDVTSAVAADANGTATFVITSTSATDRAVVFSSREGANAPVLRVTSVH